MTPDPEPVERPADADAADEPRPAQTDRERILCGLAPLMPPDEWSV
ncbi:hypothetical protein [Sphingomonas sanxanigenens]|uniref:Uncharacterized protein n=1 Tax=Sphingomonas sanxanigenens DSM 19645 = NX02 TaxID=1123269 RepID=W0AIA7_9SPHN|nr:hypothetical protein [Sphingomonas sanxanigenens]AHE55998.1 hypothetical protein NX02_21840 [Sphingomonas sanxanigenens DSM 19645 = NX02]